MDSYMTFIEEWVRTVKNLESIKEVVSIYLSGSVAQGDYKVGFSDIDIYIVTKGQNHSFDDIKNETETLINRYLPEMAWCPNFMTIAYETHENILNSQTWLGMGSEYFSFIESAKLLYGEDIKHELKEPEYSAIQKVAKDFLPRLIEAIKQTDISEISQTSKDELKFIYRSISWNVLFSTTLFLIVKWHFYP